MKHRTAPARAKTASERSLDYGRRILSALHDPAANRFDDAALCQVQPTGLWRSFAGQRRALAAIESGRRHTRRVGRERPRRAQTAAPVQRPGPLTLTKGAATINVRSRPNAKRGVCQVGRYGISTKSRPRWHRLMPEAAPNAWIASSIDVKAPILDAEFDHTASDYYKDLVRHDPAANAETGARSEIEGSGPGGVPVRFSRTRHSIQPAGPNLGSLRLRVSAKCPKIPA